MKLSLTIPLQNDVQMDDVAIRAQAHLDGVHLSALVAGRDLDQGVFDLDANPDGMKLNGRALLASFRRSWMRRWTFALVRRRRWCRA